MSEQTVRINLTKNPEQLLKLGVLLGSAGVQAKQILVDKTGEGGILQLRMTGDRTVAYKIGIALGAAGIQEEHVTIGIGGPTGVADPGEKRGRSLSKSIGNIASGHQQVRMSESSRELVEGLQEGMRTIAQLRRQGLAEAENDPDLQNAARFQSMLPNLPTTIFGSRIK